ncbi:MAG: polysaccharide biosynthesis PFTS motif protein [Methanoregula sp.]|nr:MAG: polysaccharide biosynthesis PFTS motif protein [Methanoregula sp.]
MTDPETRKIVIFEEINNAYYPYVQQYLKNGYCIYYFQIDDALVKKSQIKDTIDQKRLVNLSKQIFNYTFFMDAGVYAHKHLDYIFDRYFSECKSIEISRRLFNSDEILYMYKKELLLDLQKIYDNQLRINEISKMSLQEVTFYPARYYHIYSDFSVSLLTNQKIINVSGAGVKIRNFISQFRDFFIFFYPMVILIRKVKWFTFRKKTSKEFHVGINANLPALFGYNHHYIDYLIDERYAFPRDQCLFIDETAHASFAKDIEKKGFITFDFLHKREKLSVKEFLMPFLTKTFPAWIRCLYHSLREDAVIIRTNRRIFTDVIKWNIFFDCYKIKNNISILLPDTISKSLLFSRNGCRTWYVYPDNSAADYVSGYDETVPIATVHTFMKSDFAVVFGNKIIRYFSNNRNSIGYYVPVGVLASQRIREIREGKVPSLLSLKIQSKGLKGTIIGIFDNSFADWAPNTVSDGIRFGEEILMLLDEFPNINIIFKEKKPLSATPELAPVYEKLENHPRCLVVRKTETDCIFSTDVIAFSDLVISVAYTSTNAEALGAKVKSIYYNVAGRDIGGKYYFNRYPNFVAHDYMELKKLVRYWLYEITNEQFEAFLERYVKGEIDQYLDMKAIDRLQTLLLS